MSEPITLSRPITAIDRTFTEITLREPTGADLVAVGYPLRFTGRGDTEVNADMMSSMIAKLAGLPRSAVTSMPARDWQVCMLGVMDFFGAAETPGTPSTDTSNAAGSGATSATP